jgi:hypothetical protein
MKYKPWANILSLFFSAVCQVLAYPLSQIASYIYPNFYFYVLLHSFFAFLIASILKLPSGWRLFNLLIVPAILLYETANFPSWILLAAFVISVLIYLPAFWTRVPYYPTSPETYQVISDLLPRDKDLNFLDLGCGFSALLCYLAPRHPEMKFFGTEIGPLPYIVSKVRSLFYKNLQIKFESFWNINFEKYEVIYAFLAPPPMERLWKKVSVEMKKGGLFIVNSFEVPASPDKTIEIRDKRKCKIMLHKV